MSCDTGNGKAEEAGDERKSAFQVIVLVSMFCVPVSSASMPLSIANNISVFIQRGLFILDLYRTSCSL